MPIFQRFLLKNNNQKEIKSYISQKINSKKEKKPEILIPQKNQIVNIKKKEFSTLKIQQDSKVISITYINTKNKPKNLYFYIEKLPKDIIKKQNKEYFQRFYTYSIPKLAIEVQKAII